jgi:hypothetical protein
MSVGFGRDTWCLDSLQPGRLVSGRALLAQALYRRWTTPRGTLRGEDGSTYGIDIVGLVGAAASSIVLGALPGMMRAEALKDDRVADVQISATAVTDSRGLAVVTLAVHVTPADELEDFDLTLAVDEISVQILGGLPT